MEEIKQSRVEEIHEDLTLGDRLADRAATVIGSWHFIICQTLGIILWVIANAMAVCLHWDPYPFILLNLMFSVQAAYTGPLVMLAQNRQAEKDRIRDDRDDQEIGEILEIVRQLRSQQCSLKSD